MRSRLEHINTMEKFSDEETNNEGTAVVVTQKGRKNIRNIKDLDDLKLNTRIANRDEKQRLIRLEKRESNFKEVFENNSNDNQLILDFDFTNKVPLVTVHEALVKRMKNHQKEGVKFMWNACYESLKQIKESNGSGCIIAHCMGLGKTFQVITLVHTLLNHSEAKTKSVLICCPKNTLMNWINEFEKWITPDLGSINIYNPTRFGNHSDRLVEASEWYANGGVCIINYELIRILLEDDDVLKARFYSCLCNPGPDLVICDEGHVLKNEETKLSKAMNQIRTMRRIVLTGTPLQNNLNEYHCMIQFVKPNLLGTRGEFVNMFVNPILNGQYENSSMEDVQLMKERSHILYKKLLGCVQRFDLSTLKSFLPEKREYVVSIALTEAQIQMYRFYLNNYSAKGDPNWKNDGVALFADYQSLQRIWTHPYTLKDFADRYEEGSVNGRNQTKKKKKKVRTRESEGESTDSEETSRWARFPLFWWVRFTTIDDIEDARQSNKLVVLLNILQKCEEAGEKILVFSGSLYSLRLIQHFLNKINRSESEDPFLCNMTSTWEEGLDYLLLTGQTSSEERDSHCQRFNDPDDPRLRLFLISTKAGGIGINLTGASRAVLFDVSWNPSYDIQSIFRIYRIGQKKPCFVYRFVASGTMEEKIYERQVMKQSISYRVVDEKQTARHYTQRELLELYFFEPKEENKTKGIEPQDPLLEKVLREEAKRIVGVHEHDSLLEHKTEEELQELEKNDAWMAYNNDNESRNLPPAETAMLSRLTPDSFNPVFLEMVLKEKHPKASNEEISSMMTALMPRINSILERSDFDEIMKRQALLHHFECRASNGKSNGKRQWNERRSKNKENNYSRDAFEPKPGTSADDHCLGSDDSVFLYDVGGKSRKGKGKARPLKVWGVRNGKPYGSPEKDF